MRYNVLKMLALSLTLAATACVGSPVIQSARSACADLVPSDWAEGVAHTDAPSPAPAAPPATDLPARLAWTLEELKKWTSFGVSEANRVDQANGRTRDAIEIIKRCEARDREAVARSRPKVFGLF